MVTYLYRHSAYFRTMVNKLAFGSQSKPMDFTNMDMSFVDSNGKKYYRYLNDTDMHQTRFERLQEKMLELASCFTGPEIDRFLEQMETLLDEIVNLHTTEGKVKNISKVIYLVQEAMKRKKILLREDILFQMAALLYIREDENPAELDDVIMAEKIEQFQIDSQGGLYDFFFNTGLSTYIPFLESIEKELPEYLEMAQRQIAVSNKMIEDITGNQPSSKEEEKAQVT